MQKRIRFILIINFIIVFIWIRFYRKNGLTFFRFVKKLWKIIFILIAVYLPVIILGCFEISEEIRIIISYAFGYLVLLIWATIAIKDQENYLLEKEIN